MISRARYAAVAHQARRVAVVCCLTLMLQPLSLADDTASGARTGARSSSPQERPAVQSTRQMGQAARLAVRALRRAQGSATRTRTEPTRPAPASFPTSRRTAMAQEEAQHPHVVPGQGPIGNPPLHIELTPSDLTFAATDDPGVLKATAPVQVSVAAQWPEWRITCKVTHTSAPTGVDFSGANVLVGINRHDSASKPGLSVPALHAVRSAPRVGRRASLGVGAAGAVGHKSGTDLAGLDSRLEVASGSSTGFRQEVVAELAFYLDFDVVPILGNYQFTVQFYGEGPGASGIFQGPQLVLGFSPPPTVHVAVNDQEMNFGALNRGEHLSNNNPSVTVITNMDIDVHVSMLEAKHQQSTALIDGQRLALGVGSSAANAAHDAQATPLAVTQKTLPMKPGVRTFYLSGKVAIDASLPTGAYQGVVTIQISGNS